MLLSVAQIVPRTKAEGPGLRFALWFQGCPLRCPGCCNPEMLPFSGGRETPLDEVVTQLDQARLEPAVEGITLLGGEPFAHAPGAAAFARAARERNLNVMVFSGYLLEELQARGDAAIDDLLGYTDILVDAPYDRERPDRVRRWIGSTNQRIHFLSDRCRSDDPAWREPNTLEIRLEAGQLTINGFPSPETRPLWRRGG